MRKGLSADSVIVPNKSLLNSMVLFPLRSISLSNDQIHVVGMGVSLARKVANVVIAWGDVSKHVCGCAIKQLFGAYL